MFLCFPFAFAFAQELDARGVSKHVQAVVAWTLMHLNIQILLPTAHRAEVGYRPIEASYVQQRLHQTRGLP